tara:strand:- start:50 stop:262 length:213 start_codon:yes stop_codon:yes gene_type:complete
MALNFTNERIINYEFELRDMPGLLCPDCDKMYSLGGIDFVNECLEDGTYVRPLCDNLCICNMNNIVLSEG